MLGLQHGERLTASRIRDELATALTDSFLVEWLPNFAATPQADKHHSIGGIIFIARVELASASHPSSCHDFFPSTWYGV